MKSSFKVLVLTVLVVAVNETLAAEANPKVVPEKVVKTIITGQQFAFNPLKHIAIYNGDVVVIDPQMDLLCDKLTIYFTEKNKAPKKVAVPPLPTSKAHKNPSESGVGVKKKPTVAPMVGLGGNVDRIIAEGDVEIINKKDKTRAVGGHAVYTAKTEVLVLTVNPRLFTKQGVLLGKEIVYNRITGELSAKNAVLENINKPKPPIKKPPGK